MADEVSSQELKKFSLDELLNVKVFSVSKHAEKLWETASAIQVITSEDIRRSGATTLPDALRLASNLQVAQANAHDWAITGRGFNSSPFSVTSVANKLLVMIDGRSIYTPLFAGVFWDAQFVMLEDVDRIEVVSGPGGTLWGANAVNGVINVVTRSSRETQGSYVSGLAGSFLQDYGGVRYGGSVGSNLFFRVYAQRYDHNPSEMASGYDAHDAWNTTQTGFRMDWYPNTANTLTLQGDLYFGKEGQPTTPPVSTKLDGENILGTWTHTFSEDSDLLVKSYFDRTWRNHLSQALYSDEMLTYDFDLQHRFPLLERQTIVWGAGYRLVDDTIHNRTAIFFSPAQRTMQLFSAFVQDEIQLVHDHLKLALGTKLEHNDFSGFEVQPNARLTWTPNARNTLWASVSRAVRSPSRLDSDAFPVPGVEFESETVIAYELGYRVRPVDRFSASIAGFFNQYDNIRSVNLNLAAPHPLFFSNGQRADTWGAELSAEFQAASWWKLHGGYTYMDNVFRKTEAAVVSGSDRFEAVDPHHQVVIRSSMDLPSHFSFDLFGRYMDSLPSSVLRPLPGLNIQQAPAVPNYVTFDARLAWRYRNYEVALVGQNLWDNAHAEFGALQIPRSIYGSVTVRF